MSDDLKLHLDLDSSGFEETIRKIKDLERRLKAINTGINAAAATAANPNTGKVNSAAGPSRDVVRRARETLEIDRDKLRVVKQRMKYEGDLRSKAVKAIEQERRAQERRFRDNLAFSGAMHKQRLAEERALQREVERTGRIRSAQERRLDQERRRSRRDAESRMGDAGRYGRESYRTLSRAPAAAAAVGAGAAAAIGNRALRSEIDADDAEINAQIYGKLTKDAARDLRDKWAAPLAESLGVTTAKLLRSYTDALKLGVPAEGARAFAELNTKVSEAWDVPFEAVTDVMGTINTILTSTGAAFDIGKLKSVANTLQVLAAGQSTTPEKMIAFLKHGAGAAQVLKMSQESGLAFGSASTSLGNQAAESGRLFDYMASRLVELPDLVRKRGHEGKDARNMLRAMGYANAQDMDRKRRADPDAFLPDFIQRMHDIKDPKQKEKALRFFAGREWFGEMGRIVEGASTYQEAVKLQKEAKNQDAIEQVWKLHLGKLRTILARIRSGAVNLLGEIGKAFAPYLDQFATRFLEWSRKLSGGGITERIKAMFDGLIEGFGGKSLSDLLDQVFGKPGEGSVGSVETFKATAKAFAEGLRDVFVAFKGFVGAFTGGSSETIARWTGRIIALSLALAALSPVLTALGAFVAILKTASALKGLSGFVAGRGAGFGAAPLPVQVIGAVSIAGWEIMTRLIDWLVGKNPGKSAADLIDPGTGTTLERPPMSVQPGNEGWLRRWWKGEGEYAKPAEDLRKAIEQNTETLHEGAKVQRQAYEAIEDSPFRGLIHKASLNTAAQSIGDSIRNNAARAGGSALSGSVGNGPLISSSVPGGSIGNGMTGMRRRGIMGGGAGAAGGGVGSVGGSGVTNPGLSGDVAARAKEAHDYFRAQGYSEQATAGILASLSKESNFTPNARGDGGAAHGIAQWHADRRRQILAGTGIDVSRTSFSDQLKAVAWEMRSGDAGAQRAHRLLMTPGISARDAGGAFVQHFERPKRDERAERGALAEGFYRQFGGGSSGGSPLAGLGGTSKAVENARSLLGMGSRQAAAALGSKMTAGNWCADFVTGALSTANVKGIQGSIANSYLGWGQKVTDGIRAGDVVVTHRGRGVGQTGGHVGLATGQTRMKNGRLQYETISGNHGKVVGQGWEWADKVAVRRAQESVEATRAAAERAGRVNLPPGASGGAAGASAPAGPGASLGSGTPGRSLGANTPIKTVPASSGGGSAQNGGGVVNNIHVNAARHSPDEMASAVQRKLNETMNRRSHDFDQAWA